MYYRIQATLLVAMLAAGCEDDASPCNPQPSTQDNWQTTTHPDFPVNVVERQAFCERFGDVGCPSSLQDAMARYDCDLKGVQPVRVHEGCGFTTIEDATTPGVYFWLFGANGQLLAAELGSDTETGTCRTFGTRFGAIAKPCVTATVRSCAKKQLARDGGGDDDAQVDGAASF